MKKKIEALLKRLQVAVRYNPAEVFCLFILLFRFIALYGDFFTKPENICRLLFPSLISDYLYLEFDDRREHIQCLPIICLYCFLFRFLEG